MRRRGFERLIRKMLNLPKRPAVMYFHVWTPRRLGFKFFESPENLIEMVPEYYGLPSISMRNALYHYVANFTVPADWLWRSDINHANCLGHRWVSFWAATSRCRVDLHLWIMEHIMAAMHDPMILLVDSERASSHACLHILKTMADRQIVRFCCIGIVRPGGVRTHTCRCRYFVRACGTYGEHLEGPCFKHCNQ